MKLVASPGGPLRGEAAVPGDKSCSHRALILGAMADGETQIHGLLESDDVLATARAVAAFGAEVEQVGPGHWRVRGAEWRSPEEPVDCGNSGTAARLLIGAVAGMPGVAATFTGDASLSARPMRRVTAPLARMGAIIDGGEHLPLAVEGTRLDGIEHRNAPASAQVKSAILLAGLGTAAPVRVIEPVPSRDHSENMLRAFGCDVLVDGASIRLGARRTLFACPVSIPGDPSSAAFPLVAALLVPGSEVVVRSVMTNPLRTGLLKTLDKMGADIHLGNRRSVGGEPVADIRARYSPLRGIEVPAADAPSMIDEYPILAVAAAYASGRTVMHGLSELRVKESDRLAATIAALRHCGVEAHSDDDSLIVEGAGGPPPGGARIAAHHDHRIAMSFLVAGLASKAPVSVDSAGMIATSFPGFPALMRSIGADLE